MPAGDRTGPRGAGPMTGRRGGYCAGYEAPGYTNATVGRGFGQGWGRGRGWRNVNYTTGTPDWIHAGYGLAWGSPPGAEFGSYGAPPAPEQEVGLLKSQAEMLQNQLKAIEQRIAQLEEGNKKK